MTSPRQITLRDPSPQLTRRLKAIAQSRGESVNATILRLLERAVGIDARRERLLRYATWTDADGAEFDAALADQRRVDEEAWR